MQKSLGLNCVVMAVCLIPSSHLNKADAAAVAITTPANGISVPALPATVSGTGNPNGTGVGNTVFMRAPGGMMFVQIDTGFPTTIANGTWTAGPQSGNNSYTASGDYRYNAFLPIFPGVTATNNCTIP